MQRILLLCTALLFFLACSRNSDTPAHETLLPDSVISEPLMIQIIADVHLLEAGIQLNKSQGIDINAMTEGMYAGLFHKYRISERRFKLNLDHYRNNPAEFEKFYQKVIDELKSRQPAATVAPPGTEE